MKTKVALRGLTIALILIFFLSPLIFFRNTYRKAHPRNTGAPGIQPYSEIKRPPYAGEQVIYDVTLGKIPLGISVFTSLPDEQLNGRRATVAKFETKLAHFKDIEKIYSDPDTYLPLRVERVVDIWPKIEKITEDYNQEKFSVTIKKTKFKNQETALIEKENVINNAILLPFYVSRTATFEIGYNFVARLPTREFTIRVAAKEEVVVPAGRFIAYHFKSTPEQFEIWISDDERRIPLKIKGVGNLGYTLAMREYHKPPGNNQDRVLQPVNK